MAKSIRPDGQKIMELRRQRGFTSRLAVVQAVQQLRREGRRIVAVSESAIRDTERGRPVYPSTLQAIAAALGLESMESLLQRPSANKTVTVQSLRESTAGRWEAKIDQKLGPGGKPFRQTIQINLWAGSAGIEGEFIDSFTEQRQETNWEFGLSGDYYVQRFLQLECRAKDPAILQFSVWVLELGTDARTLTGQFVGYGALTKAIISGSITLSKLEM